MVRLRSTEKPLSHISSDHEKASYFFYTKDTYIEFGKGGITITENKREIGSFYEERAAQFLQEHGLCILEKNFRCRSGEIDLIAREESTIVFVEVKYRYSGFSGNASEAVDLRKQRMISKVAAYYLYTRVHSFDVPCRFDVIAFDGECTEWLKHAFDYQS